MPTPWLGSQQFLDALSRIRGDGHSDHAHREFKNLMLTVIGQYDKPRVLEVGGGRSPMFAQDLIDELGAEYTVNDIDAGELALSPEWVSRLHGDIADAALLDLPEHDRGYDVVFSNMVFEHVANPRAAYANIARLLAPGGVVVNFVPTLYATPFIVNKLLPERLSARILRAVAPYRSPSGIPKFPAFYRWCTSTDRTARKLKATGFGRTLLVPFFGHPYYEPIPLLRHVNRRIWPVAARRDWRRLSTYAYVMAEAPS